MEKEIIKDTNVDLPLDINKPEKPKKFGLGYPVSNVDRSIRFNIVCEEKEISPNIDIVDTFRIQYDGDESDPDTPVRWRSDVSMLFHAEDTIKKIGPEGYRYLSESRRTKTSAVQQLYDQMSDEDLLSTVKSRHIQSPSELLAWSESLNDIASQLRNQSVSQDEPPVPVSQDEPPVSQDEPPVS